MNKYISLICTALISTTTLAGMTVHNDSIAFKSLPTEIQKDIKTNYIEFCQSISEDKDSGITNPKITFYKEFITKVDFNNDGLADYIIRTNNIACEGAASLFTGNSEGAIEIYFQTEGNKFQHVLSYESGKSEMELKKTKNGYGFFSADKSYLIWNKSLNKFISYYGPEKRKNILDIENK